MGVSDVAVIGLQRAAERLKNCRLCVPGGVALRNEGGAPDSSPHGPGPGTAAAGGLGFVGCSALGVVFTEAAKGLAQRLRNATCSFNVTVSSLGGVLVAPAP